MGLVKRLLISSLVLGVLLIPKYSGGITVGTGGACYYNPSFIKGDVNNDRKVNLEDIGCLINYQFAGSFAPGPLSRGDVNDDGAIDIRDIAYLREILNTKQEIGQTTL